MTGATSAKGGRGREFWIHALEASNALKCRAWGAPSRTPQGHSRTCSQNVSRVISPGKSCDHQEGRQAGKRKNTNRYKKQKVGGTPPLLDRNHPVDVSHLSCGNVPSVPRTFCPIYVEMHIHQVGTFRMSRDSLALKR